MPAEARATIDHFFEGKRLTSLGMDAANRSIL